MIITPEVQEVFDVWKKADRQDLIDAGTQMLETIDDTLGDDLERWYGAYAIEILWQSWFAALCLGWPGGPSKAYETLPAPDALMLVDKFIESHPLTKAAILKYGPPGGFLADGEEVPEMDEVVALVSEKMKQGGMTEPSKTLTLTKEEGDRLFEMLGYTIKDGKMVKKESKHE